MNPSIKAGEVFQLKDLLPYQEGKIVNMDIVKGDGMKFALLSFDKGTGLSEQSAPGYQPSGKPMAWLLTIARNLALMRLRKAESKNLSFDELFHVEDTHDAYQTTENHMVLEKVLHTLTDSERQIVMLHALSGLKHQ